MEDVLANLLLSSPAIADLVGTNVDWDVAAQGAAGPRIIMFVISAPQDYTLQGRINHFETRVQFDCRANTALLRRQLVAALDDLLSGYRGEFSGVRFDGLFKDGQRTRFDLDGAEKWFQAQIDYRIWWAPASP